MLDDLPVSHFDHADSFEMDHEDQYVTVGTTLMGSPAGSWASARGSAAALRHHKAQFGLQVGIPYLRRVTALEPLENGRVRVSTTTETGHEHGLNLDFPTGRFEIDFNHTKLVKKRRRSLNETLTLLEQQNRMDLHRHLTYNPGETFSSVTFDPEVQTSCVRL